MILPVWKLSEARNSSADTFLPSCCAFAGAANKAMATRSAKKEAGIACQYFFKMTPWGNWKCGCRYGDGRTTTWRWPNYAGRRLGQSLNATQGRQTKPHLCGWGLGCWVGDGGWLGVWGDLRVKKTSENKNVVRPLLFRVGGAWMHRATQIDNANPVNRG